MLLHRLSSVRVRVSLLRSLGNLGYGGTLGTNYPFVYTSTFPSPDSQHPLLLSNGQPATMESAFTTIDLQDPTINSGQGLNLYGR